MPRRKPRQLFEISEALKTTTKTDSNQFTFATFTGSLLPGDKLNPFLVVELLVVMADVASSSAVVVVVVACLLLAVVVACVLVVVMVACLLAVVVVCGLNFAQ